MKKFSYLITKYLHLRKFSICVLYFTIRGCVYVQKYTTKIYMFV